MKININMDNLIKDKLDKALIFEFINTIIDEDYPSSFNMDHFKTISKFNNRVNYCEQNLKRISSGSGRIVYMVDATKVLKLAKNKKGVAQCNTEIEWCGDYYFDSILAHVIEHDENGLWVEMELAKKVSTTNFKDIIGFDFKTFSHYINNRYNDIASKRGVTYHIDKETLELLYEDDFINTIVDYADSVGAVGDLQVLSTYGIVKRDGIDTIVIIDFGLTNDVYQSYYA